MNKKNATRSYDFLISPSMFSFDSITYAVLHSRDHYGTTFKGDPLDLASLDSSGYWLVFRLSPGVGGGSVPVLSKIKTMTLESYGTFVFRFSGSTVGVTQR